MGRTATCAADGGSHCSLAMIEYVCIHTFIFRPQPSADLFTPSNAFLDSRNWVRKHIDIADLCYIYVSM